MFAKTLIGSTMLFCIGCLGAGNHDASHAEIRKNTEDITVPKKGIVVVVLVNGSCSKVNVDQWVE